MTRKQLERAQSTHRKMALDWFSPEMEFLRAIEIMHSILIYEYRPDAAELPYPADNFYMKEFAKSLGESRMKEVWEDQVADYRKAIVTDLPGGYKSCKWADEQ